MNIYVPVTQLEKKYKLTTRIGLAGFNCVKVYVPPIMRWAEKLNQCIKVSTDRATIIALTNANLNRRLVEIIMGMHENRYRFIRFVNSSILCVDKFYLQQVGLFDPTFTSFEVACYDMAIRFHEKECAIYEGVSPLPELQEYYSLGKSDIHSFNRKWKSYRNGFRRLRPEKLPCFHTTEFQNRAEPVIQNAEMSVVQPGEYSFANLGCLCGRSTEAAQRKENAHSRIEGFNLNEIRVVENTRERCSIPTPQHPDRNQFKFYTR